MFIVLLRFSRNKDNAPDFMQGHRLWLQQGFDDGLFLLAGTLKPGIGGGVLAVAGDRKQLTDFVNQDPFVVNDVVTAEILEMEPARASEQLDFLLK